VSIPIGLAVRGVREHRKLSQALLAKEAGCYRTMICKVETARKRVTVDMLLSHSTALRISPAKLLRYAQSLESAKEGSK
jgi:transcriptional regulator with XRE-family HTH domain